MKNRANKHNNLQPMSSMTNSTSNAFPNSLTQGSLLTGSAKREIARITQKVRNTLVFNLLGG